MPEDKRDFFGFISKIDHKALVWCLFYGIFVWFLAKVVMIGSGETVLNLSGAGKMHSPFHYWMAAVCGGVCLVFLIQSYKVREVGKGRLILAISDMGKLSVLGSIASATLLGAIGLYGGEQFVPYLDVLTYTAYGSTAAVAVCICTIWPYNVVGKGMIDVVNGQAYYPGERYTVFPFIKNEIISICDILCLPTMKFPLEVNHKGAMLVVSTRMNLSADEMQRSGIRKFDPYGLMGSVMDTAKAEIEASIISGQKNDGHPGNFFKLVNDLPENPKMYTFEKINVTWPEIGNFRIEG